MRPHGALDRRQARIATVVIGAGAIVLASMGLAQAWPDEPAPSATAIPWGIASSAGSFKNHEQWLPKLANAGVATVRLFPEWRSFEPNKGTWQWAQTDDLVKAATANKIEINAILMGSPPGTRKSHAFPMDDLDGWSRYVSAVVQRYKKPIRYWEVWNEGNGGFNDDHHTTADYAKLAIATHAAAKKADPHAQVGLTVASFDPAYLDQALRVMTREGRPSSFDYLCIHPYEIADGLAEADGEVPFLWMTRLLRDMLKSSAPDRVGAEIWITEVGHRIEQKKGHAVSEADAAKALVKIYTLALAQGIQRTQWFEAQDPVGEDLGFGLLNREGNPRLSYQALKTMTKRLGATPKYQGWLTLGRDDRGYGFVFQGESGPVLVAWMPAGHVEKALSFTADVEAIDALTGSPTPLKSRQALSLTDSPVYVTGVPADLLKQARDVSKNFPWGGDFATAKMVSGEPGHPEGKHGVVQLQRDATPTVTFADGSTGILASGDRAVSFYVHPSFASFQTREYYVRVSVRRVSPGNVGMNLFYEVADSQGRSPYKNRGEWFSVSAKGDWQTYTWHVTDACFAKMWGFDISFRPEKSAPFVIGKVEVSTTAFK